MSEQALQCTPPQKKKRSSVGYFFSHRCLVQPKIFPKEKVDFIGVIKRLTDRAQKTCFCQFLLKLDFHQLSIT